MPSLAYLTLSLSKFKLTVITGQLRLRFTSDSHPLSLHNRRGNHEIMRHDTRPLSTRHSRYSSAPMIHSRRDKDVKKSGSSAADAISLRKNSARNYLSCACASRSSKSIRIIFACLRRRNLNLMQLRTRLRTTHARRVWISQLGSLFLSVASKSELTATNLRRLHFSTDIFATVSQSLQTLRDNTLQRSPGVNSTLPMVLCAIHFRLERERDATSALVFIVVNESIEIIFAWLRRRNLNLLRLRQPWLPLDATVAASRSARYHDITRHNARPMLIRHSRYSNASMIHSRRERDAKKSVNDHRHDRLVGDSARNCHYCSCAPRLNSTDIYCNRELEVELTEHLS